MKELIIIRGLPGSGKSTMAKTYTGYRHYEADMFHVVNGMYKFRVEAVGLAHEWCIRKTKESLLAGLPVVVSNTFTTNAEMEPYRLFCQEHGIPCTVIEAKGNYASIHNVPADIIEKMKARWEITL